MKPRLALIATGGTIAGTGPQHAYTAGVLPAEKLLASPALIDIADWQAEQALSLDSRDIQPAHWLMLAERVRCLRADPAIVGIVITHGTDTLEETAFALDLLLAPGKPVVLTGAMRPADSPAPDGPQNLLHAAIVARHPAAGAHGVLVVANATIIAARDLVKSHTHAIDALACRPGSAPVGSINAGLVTLREAPAREYPPLDVPATSSLPRIDILHASAGASPDLLAASITGGSRGLVLALCGHGSIPAAWRPAIAQARAQGLVIVRASRIPAGGVEPGCNEDDQHTGCIAAGNLSPQQARVLLLLALASGQYGQLRERFANA